MLIPFLKEIQRRNSPLYIFGWIHLLAAFLMFLASLRSETVVYQVSAWYKPLKFALATWIYAWTMAWYCFYLPKFHLSRFNWAVILTLGFEVIYITFQASQGEISHYNISSPIYSALYSGMALAASILTLYTAYVGVLFCIQKIPQLPKHYLWAIRMGIFLFVLFSFQGFLMGTRMNHSVGAINDNSNLLILGWSQTFGDLRVAHFFGMHALQVLPLASYYILKNTTYTLLMALCYGLFAFGTLIQALLGNPFL
jgi:hypothetical protein